ncbi:hypothetical protein Syun_004368 [Stephania yunnanensis]|uniref:Uncharacterized protein n=1 Tax=Stephania yunnanensis TaxID=152371 RepID=A0AAP0Q4V9_9MAGN
MNNYLVVCDCIYEGEGTTVMGWIVKTFDLGNDEKRADLSDADLRGADFSLANVTKCKNCCSSALVMRVEV